MSDKSIWLTSKKSIGKLHKLHLKNQVVDKEHDPLVFFRHEGPTLELKIGGDALRDLRVTKVFCGGKDYEEMQECKNYRRVSRDDLGCLHLDAVTGVYEEYCACTAKWKEETRAETPLVIVPQENSHVAQNRVDVLTSNSNVLTRNGYFPNPCVKFIQVSGTYVIRIKGMPKVDFFAPKSKWRDVETGEMHYGDANKLVQFLKDGERNHGKSKISQHKIQAKATKRC